MTKLIVTHWLFVVCLAGAAALHAGDEESAAALPKKLQSEHLPNPIEVHPKVISGGLPEADEAFAELAALGIKTVISVDGATPDVETARRHGLRYVHLPHGYDGIAAGRAKELAKAVRDLEGPLYIHCHHGKHRSPAAAAVACVGSGLIAPDDALDILKLAGTSEHYRGLYQAAQEARPFSKRSLDKLDVEFRETADIPPLAEAMVAVEHTFDHLKSIAAASWKAPAEQPDLDPPHEALLLREHYTELLRTDDVKGRSLPFQDLLREAETAAQDLETALRDWKQSQEEPADEADAVPDVIAETFQRLSDNCTACHRKFRDVPLGEKE